MEINSVLKKLPSVKDVRSLGIRHYKTAPLIKVKYTDGKLTVMYAKTPDEKDELIKDFDEASEVLMWPWPGKWSTDVFQVTKKDLAVHYIQ